MSETSKGVAVAGVDQSVPKEPETHPELLPETKEHARLQLPSRRSTVALITAITGLISAFAAYHRTPPEPTAKEGYVTLQKAFVAQGDEIEALGKDLLALRASFEAYARAKEGEESVTQKLNGPNVLPPVEVRVRQQAQAVYAADAAAPPPASSVVVIPSARTAPPRRKPLPDVSELGR